jgi:hypothetical protein
MATACQTSRSTSNEPQVQLTMGTQTGGSTANIYCGPEAWENAEEEAPFGTEYVGAVQLQGWRIECEKECMQACQTNCSGDCSLTEAPAGNARDARLHIEVTGPVERRVLSEEYVNHDCEAQRRTTMEWELEVDGSFVASGTETLNYVKEGFGYLSLRNTVLDPDPSFVAPSPSDFAELGSNLGENVEIAPAGILIFGGVEAGVEMTFACRGCSGRVGVGLAAGVLHEEGKPHDPPQEVKQSPTSWHWEESECIPPTSGGGGTPNLPSGGGGSGGTDPSETAAGGTGGSGVSNSPAGGMGGER